MRRSYGAAPPASVDESVTTAPQTASTASAPPRAAMRRIFGAWRTITSADARAVKTSGTASWRRLLSSAAPNVAVPAAVSDPTDIVRLRARAPIPPAVAHAAASGETTTSPPNAVATALPPRNLAKTGHEWPTHAASPAAACAAGSAPHASRQADRRGALGDVEREGDRPRARADGAQHVGGAHVAAAEITDVEAADGLADDQAEGHRSDQIAGGAARRRRRVASHAPSSLAPDDVGGQRRHPGDGRSSKVGPPSHAAAIASPAVVRRAAW